jgi:CRP/FNR family transcriptional regulator, anaerobic regulatory protein
LLRLLRRPPQLSETPDLIWLPRRDEMGALLDMTVETASRLVSAMRRAGVLLAGLGRFSRIDMKRLQSAPKSRDDA